MRNCSVPDTLDILALKLMAGRTTSRALTEACLARIAEPNGQGARTFPHGPAARALQDADLQDQLRRAGQGATPFAGIPISVKDNIDQAGEVTHAGSHLFDSDPPASADATAVARLRAAGFVVIGRTNMTELAFSGLGLNPHYGTPANPRCPEALRIPGGSSSGAAVSVAAGMASAAIGTDTGGSCRIPAAFCGLVGFKSSAGCLPLDGVFPLSPTLDSLGALGLSARCCATLDAVMSGEPGARMVDRPPSSLKIGILGGFVLDDLSPQVDVAFQSALERLQVAGARLEAVEAPGLREVAVINARGGFAAIELFARLRTRLATDAARVDPRVLRRLMLGADRPASDLADMHAARARLIAEVAEALDAFDVVVMPTTPVAAPRLDVLAADPDYDRINGLVLRNPSIANMLDRPAVSLPCETECPLPVGFTLMGRRGADRDLLAVAAGVEAIVRT